MHNRLNQWRADLRFWLWKARTYHTQRYIAIITVVVTLGGVAFYSYTSPFFVRKAQAALGATYNGTTLTVDGGGKYLLVADSSCVGGGSSLWPLNVDSASKINNQNVGNPSYKGKLCIGSADNVVVDNFASLSLVGDVTLGTLKAQNWGIVTTAPADAHGIAAQYSSRPHLWAARWTGFLQIDPPTSGFRTYNLWTGSVDDATVIELDPTSPAPVSVDAASWNFRNSVANWDNTGACWTHPSFLSKTSQSSCAPGFNGRAGELDDNFRGSGHKFPISINASTPRFYIPIRVTTWQSTGGPSRAQLQWQIDANPSVTVPVSNLLAPYVIEDGTARLGKMDPASVGYMRFEYATSAFGDRVSNVVDRVFANNGAGEYDFFDRVSLGKTGTFENFGKQASTGTDNTNFDYYWNNSDAQSAGSPLSNAQRDDSMGYRLGAAPPSQGVISLLQNYRLQNHNDDAGIGTPAGIRLTTSGDVSLSNNGSFNVSNSDAYGGKGLPGGIAYYPGYVDRGISGVGGTGSQWSPGMWNTFQGSGCDHSYASHWNRFNGNGGGGGGAGKCDAPGPGGGGGGAIGYGAAGMATDVNGRMSINGNNTDTLTNSLTNYGAGGGGLHGVGGGSNGDDVNYYINNSSSANKHDRYNGSANPGSYTTTTITGMGGGGSQGSEGQDKHYQNFPAGSGGGKIVLNIGGSLTMSNGRIMADGENPIDYGEGAGGAGTVDITVKGNGFDFDAKSYLHAVGGATVHDITPNNPDTNPPTSYAMGGQGGGGLVKVRALNFTPSSGSGWPTDYCNGVAQPFKAVFGPIGNIDARGGQSPAGYSKSQAGDGLVDLAYVSGNTFCEVVAPTSAQDVQISKRIQQWTGTGIDQSPLGAKYVANVRSDVNWSDSVTTVSGTYLRVTITVRNPDATNPRTVNVSDVLPTGVPVVPAGAPVVPAGTNVCIRTKPAPPDVSCSVLTTNTGTTLSKDAVTVPKNSTVDVMYVAQVNNPL